MLDTAHQAAEELNQVSATLEPWSPVILMPGRGASEDGLVGAGNREGWGVWHFRILWLLAKSRIAIMGEGWGWTCLPCFLRGSSTCGWPDVGTGQIVPGGQASAAGLIFTLLPQVPGPITWRGAWSRLLTSADTGRASRSQPDTSWQPHLHKSLIV